LASTLTSAIYQDSFSVLKK